MGAKAPGRTGALFRRRFALEQEASPRIEVRALRAVEVKMDGRLALSQPDLGAWKEPLTAELGPLAAGPHELVAAVVGENGPPVLRVGGDLPSGAGWEASLDGKDWKPARLAERFERSELALKFPSAARAFAGRLPLLVPLFALGVWAARRKVPAGRVRWALLGAWLVLALRSFWLLPSGVGYDVGGHADYVRFLLETGRTPLATDGWQMFQAPLYYLLSAPLYALWDGSERALRVLPLLCGVLQVEVGWRAARLAFPEREDLHALGALFAAGLPMSLYLSQGAGNEPLAGLLSAWAVLLAWGGSAPLAVGLALGLALLTKVSAVLMLPPLVAWVYARRRSLQDAVWLLAAAAAVCGWYYARNWVELGSPFVGGWDPARGLAWWQEPGYRTWRHLLSFGEALRHPVYSALAGFWDSIYSTLWLDGCLSSRVRFEARPPWDYSWMIAGAWLGLVPTALIGVGLRSRGAHARFSRAAAGLYLLALLALYLKVPSYSAAKATYALGLAPCLGVLLGAGAEKLSRWRSLVWGGMLCWASAAYLAYLL